MEEIVKFVGYHDPSSEPSGEAGEIAYSMIMR
jgi:hypothetical protein